MPRKAALFYDDPASDGRSGSAACGPIQNQPRTLNQRSGRTPLSTMIRRASG